MTVENLPRELERVIFELSAKESRRDIPSLMLVAHRVSIWLKPILYQTVIRPRDEGKPNGNPPGETLASYALHVRHLLISVAIEAPEVTEYLSSCKNIENLALWSIVNHPGLVHLMSPLRLKRLSINLNSLSCRNHSFEYMLPAFCHLTHLEIVNQLFGWETINGIQDIPNLTHVAFNGLRPLSLLVDRVLEGCCALEVVVLFEPLSGERRLMTEDVRVVVMNVGNWVDDWEKGVMGYEDFWTRAEFVVAARKAEKAIGGTPLGL